MQMRFRKLVWGDKSRDEGDVEGDCVSRMAVE